MQHIIRIILAVLLAAALSCSDVISPDHGKLLPLESAIEFRISAGPSDHGNPALIVRTKKWYMDTCFELLFSTFNCDLSANKLRVDIYGVQFISYGVCFEMLVKSTAVWPLEDLPPGVYALELEMHYRHQASVVDDYIVHYFPPDSVSIYPPQGDSSYVYEEFTP